jgi:FkbM family methyltransferase
MLGAEDQAYKIITRRKRSRRIVNLTNVKNTARSARKHFELFGIEGVFRRAIIGLPGCDNIFHASIPNSDGKALIRLGTTDVAAFEHVFCKEEYGFRLLHKPSVIVDVGANVGMSAIFFSLQYPTAKVIAIEPEPSNFAVLSRNAKRFANIVPVHAGLWNRDGRVTIQDGGSGSWGTRVSDTVDSSAIFARSLTMSTLLAEYEIKQIDLLKIDAEGAECEIFEDFARWISQVSVICAELHDRFRPGCSESFELATTEFPIKWRRGELICAAREGTILSK